MADRDIQAQILQLKKQIEALEGAFLTMRRHYEDLLNNLDEDNFAANYKVQQGNRFSKIEQTAEGITTKVGELRTDVDKNQEKISTVEQTANSVSSEVAILYNTPVALYGKIPDENSATNVLYAYYIENDNGDVINDNKKYSFSCYYKYNTVFEKWEPTDTKSIISRFEQTADGFKLDGDVKINGNTYQNGNIYVTGKGIEDGSAVYVCNGDAKNITGFISFDTAGTGEYETKDRMIIAATTLYNEEEEEWLPNALKITTLAGGNVEKVVTGNLSIGAGMWAQGDTPGKYSGKGYIYISSPIVFSKYEGVGGNSLNNRDVVFQDGCRVDFTDATVTGLHAVFE